MAAILVPFTERGTTRSGKGIDWRKGMLRSNRGGIKMSKKILVVDDEKNIQELIGYNLEVNGFKAEIACSGEEALEKIQNTVPDAVILDLMLPGIDGLEVCRQIRTNSSTKDIPVIMLTAKSDEFDKVLGLELGADDYITKPFSTRELMARVKAIFRRIGTGENTEGSTKIKFGDVTIDLEKREVCRSNQVVDMPYKEFEILKLLSQNIGKVVTRELLLEKVWGYEYFGETRTVDVHMRHIRQKIEDEGNSPQSIETVRNVGYKLIVKGE